MVHLQSAYVMLAYITSVHQSLSVWTKSWNFRCSWIDTTFYLLHCQSIHYIYWLRSQIIKGRSQISLEFLEFTQLPLGMLHSHFPSLIAAMIPSPERHHHSGTLSPWYIRNHKSINNELIQRELVAMNPRAIYWHRGILFDWAISWPGLLNPDCSRSVTDTA